MFLQFSSVSEKLTIVMLRSTTKKSFSTINRYRDPQLQVGENLNTSILTSKDGSSAERVKYL